MIGSWQISGLSVSRMYIEYADAYLTASGDMTARMLKPREKCTWPNACVAMLLAAHSLELFLKGIILTKSPSEALASHRLTDLEKRYQELFPEPTMHFELPFRTEYLGITDAEIEILKKDEVVPSILFRYPVRSPCVEWEGIHSFDPKQFLIILEQVEKDYARVISHLDNI